ncbi:MAG: hypothetical protein L6Q54_04610 [Leptospiraceae bacterium]|nr:hypothetical protein [Leptospiraceae bacterium]MCK6380517.1 hypothetical protein [Leptospiraceae bacterium]NUM41049.1 hypothetical protein [Leptospiraceae bacterium]
MGAQMPTYSNYLQSLSEEWKPFKKTLNREEQVYFDKLFAIAIQHSHAGSMQSNPFPLEVVFMTVLIQLLKDNENLKNRVKELEKWETFSNAT